MRALLLATLALSAPALAQPAPLPSAQALARQYVQCGFLHAMRGEVSLRSMATEAALKQGLPITLASRAADQMLMPALCASSPELTARLEVVIASVFTAEELDAMIRKLETPAARSAEAKGAAAADQMTAETTQWALETLAVAVRDNADAMRRGELQ